MANVMLRTARKVPQLRANLWRTLTRVTDLATTGGGDVQSSKLVVPRGRLKWAMGLILAAYIFDLALPANMTYPVLELSLSLLVYWLPAAVCWVAVSRAGFRRWEVRLGACAVTANAAGNTYFTLMTVAGASLSFPSLADVGFMLFYPLMLTALALAVRHHSRGLESSSWLDSAVGSLGAASVLAVLLSPVLAGALSRAPLVASLFALAYAMLDLLLVSAVTGISALRGVRGGDRWLLLVSGLAVFCAADVIFALQLQASTYEVGTPLDAGWPIGLALIALYVDGAARDERFAPVKNPTTGATVLSVSVASTAAGLGVLLVSSRTHLSTLAVALAGVTLIASTARTQVGFRQMGRMADLRRRDAITDDLTGLPNRRALYAEARVRLVEPQRHALLMLDLDRFKEVNDSLGHHVGDDLLVQVGARLGEHLRVGDLLVRLGGDEFAVLLEGAGRHEAADVAVKLGAALTEPFDLDDVAVHSGVSIGIALFPDDGPDLSLLLRKADLAMFKAKASGSGHHVYGGVDDADLAMRLRTVDELRRALSSGGQLVVHYQPKVELRTGEVHDVEALVRWQHPTRGLLYPDTFLDLIEQAGLMRAMTRVVLAIALDQAAVWHADGRQLTVAVNLSASSLVDTDLPDEVAAMLSARRLPPGSLRLEITEEFLMADRDRARGILTRLRRHDIEISVDDFGTGYSSLAYLRDLPVDELKLDRSFVRPMIDDPRAAALVASTIALAHSLDLRMVAEGVESEGAYAELARLGCDQAQGYYMSRPVIAEELERWLDARPAADPSTVVAARAKAGQ